ncbi:MAG: TTT family transport system substrate-binding component [Saliniramus fredricksonii]|uniref:TTT family transport system substrate-binding component n=1 Tax=Saliniramus fredricksonii TaxID=1653334 RepID=A0A0P7XBR0_9HYPH|nr:tripartite tricarboxylate transporter substrate binding protein [Saliniramus fredricksonii]KPQ12788.1 MAG: TTT family transport system substrate-binding component [Saliniramus fredricksonii]SCC82537.1 Tripartite-type tricarboxylate transporter, receptor component TctC [Saliniramus fredricksonii]
MKTRSRIEMTMRPQGKTRRGWLMASAAAVVIGAVGMSGAAQAQSYPDRPLTLIVPWGAGGGTDATARIVASLLEGELGQPVNVVNRTGGSGVVGHSAIAEAEPDGYTIGMATVEINMMHWQGLTDLTWEDYTPLALVNEDPAAVHVRADSQWGDLNDMLDAIRDNPGEHRASGTGQGGIWHLAIAGLLSELDMDPTSVPWVPSQGAAPGLQDLVAGGVDIVPSSIPEARSLLDAGRVKSLAVMSSERNAAFPDVPTTEEIVGVAWNIGAWRAIVGPQGLPEEAVETLTAALETVYNSDEYAEFMSGQGFGMRWAVGDDLVTFMGESNENLGDVMREVGLAE